VELLERLIPQAEVLQRWWRIVRGEKVLRKMRSVVDRYAEAHHALVREFCTMRAAYLAAEPAAPEALTDAERFLRANFHSPNRAQLVAAPRAEATAGRRFELWISLKVGLPDDAPGHDPAFPGYQVFSARSAVLKRAPRYFKDYFTNADNVGNRDADGHYLVPRSWKHFDAILDQVRDGSCSLPTAYTPSTYDNRPPSSEEQELLEFLREAHFYGIEELVAKAMPRIITLKYGTNKVMLDLLRKKGLL